MSLAKDGCAVEVYKAGMLWVRRDRQALTHSLTYYHTLFTSNTPSLQYSILAQVVFLSFPLQPHLQPPSPSSSPIPNSFPLNTTTMQFTAILATLAAFGAVASASSTDMCRSAPIR